jgi:hypothetical protein
MTPKNQALIKKLMTLVKEERRIGVEILELLFEIEQRKAYSELRYSESQAYCRIQAMRAMKEVPELKEKIHSGELTVTTVSQIQTHIRKQTKNTVGEDAPALTKTQKLDFFESFANQSSKEVQNEILEREGVKRTTLLKIELDQESDALWTKVKNLSAHKTKGQEPEILKMLMSNWLNKNAPEQQKKVPSAATTVKASAPVRRTPSSLPKRHIPLSLRRQVWARDQGACQKYKSRFGIQIDHILSFAKGGAHELENLRLLCRSCNLQSGIKDFGLEKMKRNQLRDRSA